MKKVAIFLSVAIGLLLALFMVALTAQAGTPNAQEAPLNSGGRAFELNVDAQGQLWVSDLDANEIWQINPVSGAFTIYYSIPSPSDARRDEAGLIWWADSDAGRFGQLNPTSGQASWWPTPNASGLFGTQVDAEGRFWSLASGDPYMYRFNPTTNQLCTYTLPSSGTADYLLAHDDFIWLGDRTNGQLLRLNPATNQFTIWQLPTDSEPQGLVFDYLDALWWADPNLGFVVRLQADLNQLDSFDVPSGLSPQMVTSRGNHIWYSEHSSGAIGRLDPMTAVSTTQTVSSSTASATVTCATQSPALTQAITTTSGTLTWADQTYSLLVNSGGWQVYDLPSGGLPWGVAPGDDEVWFVDTGRQVLGRIIADALVTITACKVEDGDGELATTGDQIPVPNWTLYLLIDGVRQGNGRQTGADGCTTWADIGSNVNYSVEEEVPSGWLALTPTTHNFGTAVPGANLSHTFINTRNEVFIYLPLIIRSP